MTEPSQLSPRSEEFRLDVDLANQAVAKLEEVRERLSRIRRDAHLISRQASEDRTAHDLVSIEASQLLAAKADGGPGSLGVALDAGLEHVRNLIDLMKADIARHEELDSDGARALGSRS